jgi:hypothetical protein
MVSRIVLGSGEQEQLVDVWQSVACTCHGEECHMQTRYSCAQACCAGVAFMAWQRRTTQGVRPLPRQSLHG